MLLAIAVGTVISAIVGPVSLLLGDVIAADEVADVWRTWWLGDASGALIVLPLALAWAKPLPAAGGGAAALEAVLMLLASSPC